MIITTVKHIESVLPLLQDAFIFTNKVIRNCFIRYFDAIHFFMNLLRLIPLLFISNLALAQASVDIAPVPAKHPHKVLAMPAAKADTARSPFLKHMTLATFSVGFSDYYRNNITLPTGFEKGNTTGIAPVYGRVEYGISNTIGIGAIISYDAFYNNFYQLYPGFGTAFKRYGTDKVVVFSAGIGCYYHFTQIIPVKKLDLYAGVGFSINSIHHSNQPQGDSTAKTVEPRVSPSLRVGARYYLYKSGSVFADLGYDRQSLFSLGFSCRFMR